MSLEQIAEPIATVNAYEGWAVVEILGRRVRAGYVREEEQYGTRMLRIDIPGPDGTKVTEWYSGASLFALTPCDQATAELLAEDNQPEPVNIWRLEQAQRKLEHVQKERAEAEDKRAKQEAAWRSKYGNTDPLQEPYDDEDEEDDDDEVGL